jgi:purine-binding chemotaxis protein CheW
MVISSGSERPALRSVHPHSENDLPVMSTLTQSTQFITFRLGDELFAVNVAQVREVLDPTPVTKVPMAPPCMRGVVNVRGCAIPVIDLRARFGLPPAAETVNTRILVLELEIEGESAVVGGIADSVHEVIELEPGQIGPPPKIAMRWRSEFIQGLGKRGEEFIILLDINTVFSVSELTAALAAPSAVEPGESPSAVRA